MGILLKISRYFVLFVLIILLASLFSEQSWVLYQSVFREPGGSWLDLSDAVGFILNYMVLVPFLLVLLGEKSRYWVTAILLIPILLFEISSGFRFVTVDISLVVIGLGIGFVARYLAARTLGKMPALGPMRKYF
ncbi:hypothetical protein A3C18_00335 [Candidatus Kaiserbacteria bacterium RIFCSPHIGHO2_02_FULL_54_11b]|uniref:Uncharacterized protein n=2 Tax=Candidatus Kaiseribacteriota TaxID=1752734 RepID=A0A1F6CQD8_9BACT|nr:MAG: hypothetical protein A2704_03400 [Candidatus Kaiserbacteria bacterium RIFCSPHIGHO2_01_FULL_54_36b]OGG64886.1 MAG: hypothetical protein A3C18_00335 [Candidatus Kaiserbacteria bacterium RIFCSPHIGHO2_02_FULL_54_11b]